jgi:hypothetical protein
MPRSVTYGYRTLLPNSPLWDQARRLRRRGRGQARRPTRLPASRSRLLRAAWRPCSRGPARRARSSMDTHGSPQAGSILRFTRDPAGIGHPFTGPRDRLRRVADVKAAARRTRWLTASLDIATATRSAHRTRDGSQYACASSVTSLYTASA